MTVPAAEHPNAASARRCPAAGGAMRAHLAVLLDLRDGGSAAPGTRDGVGPW